MQFNAELLSVAAMGGKKERYANANMKKSIVQAPNKQVLIIYAVAYES